MLIFYCNPHDGNMNNIRLTTANVEKLSSLPRLLTRYLRNVVMDGVVIVSGCNKKAYLTKISV